MTDRSEATSGKQRQAPGSLVRRLAFWVGQDVYVAECRRGQALVRRVSALRQRTEALGVRVSSIRCPS